MHNGQGGQKAARSWWGELATPCGKGDGPTIDTFESLVRYFRLAHLLFPDRSTAIDILSGALQKWKSQFRREAKRLYWRDKHPSQAVRRIIWQDADVLQWLIMMESEEYEREQEQTGDQTRTDMVVRYLKHLVQVTTAMSSFYVNIGLTRLVYDYSTSEAKLTHEMLTGRDMGPDVYRRGKAILMGKIEERFSRFVRTTRTKHGEVRFESCDDQERWIRLVHQCLTAFSPWSTQGTCSQLMSREPTFFPSAGGSSVADQNQAEINCCHKLIEPTCYSRLMKALAFDPPEKRLGLPRFFMQEKMNHHDAGARLTRDLTPEECDHIRARLAAGDERREKIDPRRIRILVDRVQRAQMDLSRRGELQIELRVGANLVEIRGEDDAGDLLLGTHLISYETDDFDFSEGTATLSDGKLELTINPIENECDDPRRAMLLLKYRPKVHLFRPLTVWDFVGAWLRPIRLFALTGFAMAVIGWGLGVAFYSHKTALLQAADQRAADHQRQELPMAATHFLSYVLVRDKERVRSSEDGGIPEVPVRFPGVTLELPIGQRLTGNYSAELKSFKDDRTLMTQNVLRAQESAAGRTVAVLVPAELLDTGIYYSVVLRGDHSEEIDRFTFHVIADK